MDLLIDLGDRFETYKIKFSATPNSSMAKSLIQFSKDYPVQKAAILNLRKERLPLSKDIVAVHWMSV